MTAFAHLTGRRLETGYLALSESTYPGGLVQAAHGHPDAYVTCVLAGAYDERVLGRRRRVEQGAIVYHPAEEEHAVRFRTRSTQIFRLTPTPALLEAARLVGVPFDRIASATPLLQDFAHRVHTLAARATPEAILAVDVAASEFVAALRTRSTRGPAPVPRAAIDTVRDYLDVHYAHGPSLPALAALAQCHPVTLARAFRRQTGRSIGAYLRQRRLEAACRLLRESTQPLSVVAADAGYADQAHLTRALRRATGMTPTQVRDARR